MKFFAKGPKEEEKKEKCESTVDKGVMIERGWQLRSWRLASKNETIIAKVHHCHYQQLQWPQHRHTQ